ncbi:hypothetical protein [Actinoplanes sp. G11-F43]|uniref:hypothetical protein n=1 Tax=Actinoplanes sp. G11-F43 TaxID=3424130 RepID=UPI003D34F50E
MITILAVPTQQAFRISYLMSAVVFALGAALVLLLIRRATPAVESPPCPTPSVTYSSTPG